MAVTGWEIIVAVGILVVVFLWGPSKIPQLARSIGQAKKEFEVAQKEFTSPSSPSDEATVVAAPASPDDTLISTAKKLGLSTEGKTRDDLSREIIEKANANKTPAK